MANYRIKSITWNGLLTTISARSNYAADTYIKFKLHEDYYYFRNSITVNTGNTMRMLADHMEIYDGTTYRGMNYYTSSIPAGTPLYYDLGTVTDASEADQYTSAFICDLSVSNTQLTDIKLKLEANAAGELIFTMPAVHACHATRNANLVPMTSLIVVYEGNDILWQGRLISKTENLDGSIDCAAEGLLACMNDGFVAPYNHSEGIGINAQTLVNYYTAQHYFALTQGSSWMVQDPTPANEVRCYPFRRWFSRGTMTDLYNVGTIYRSDTEWSTMATLIKEAITEPLGGFFYLTYSDTADNVAPALNYVSDISSIGSSRTVRFGVNLKNFQIDKDCSDFYTHMLPLGKIANDVSTEGGSSADGRFRISYGTYNDVDVYGCIEVARSNGYPFVNHMARAGRIIKTVQFDDCSSEAELYISAKKRIWNLNIDWTYDIEAVDMNIIDSAQQATPIHIGDTLQVFLYGNQSQTPDFQAVVLAIDINISKPWESTYTIGNLNDKKVTRGLS